MKIVHVIRTIDPKAGGPPIVATRLAAAQAGLGHEVHIVAHEASDAAERVRTVLSGLPHGEKINYHPLPNASRIERLFAFGARRHVAGMLENIDVGHVHGIWAPIAPAVTTVLQRGRVPYVVTPHGMLDPWSMQQSRTKKRIGLMMGFGRMLHRASLIHMLNDDEANLAKPLGLTPPTVVIANGVFLEELDPLPEPGRFRAAHPALGDRPFVLFLSRLHYKKGLDHLANAFASVAKRNDDAHLVVAGPDDGAQADFEASIAAAGIGDRVHVVGPVYGDDKLAALVDATCFCLPSRQEGFSIAITEALACGLPVVITDQCHFPEVAEVEAGAVVPVEPEPVADALVKILGDDALRDSMSAAGRNLIETRFTWPRIAERMIEAYEGLL